MTEKNYDLLLKKYQSLLSGLIPDDYKDHILNDKLLHLYQENLSLEKTIQQLRHQISNQIEKQKYESSDMKLEKTCYKFHALSTELAKCLKDSGCELSMFSESYNDAIQALKTWGEGFSAVTFSMRKKLFAGNKQLLEFMHSILNELFNLRSQLTIVQNYVAVLEFNEISLRDSLKRLEPRFTVNRSASVSRFSQINTPDGKNSNKNFILDIIPAHRNDLRTDEIQSKVNKLKLSLDKLKIQKERAEIETEKLLLQLKQTKEQLAMTEETASGNELLFENKLKRLNLLLAKLKEIPKAEVIIMKFEKELESERKGHSRSRSNNVN